MKTLSLFALFLCLIWASFAQSTLPLGSTCPDFTVVTAEGSALNLYDMTATGKHVAMVISFAGCSPSAGAPQAIDLAYTQLGCGGDDVEFIGIVNGTSADALQVIDESYVSYPLAANTALTVPACL